MLGWTHGIGWLVNRLCATFVRKPLPRPALVTIRLLGAVAGGMLIALFVFNGSVAPDRVVTPSGSAHGDSMVVGFTTSSSASLPADRMVSKIGSGAQSNFVLVHQASTVDNDFTCSPKCRWGDYAGATSDPAAAGLTAVHGQVWMTNETVTQGNNTTWNWEARP